MLKYKDLMEIHGKADKKLPEQEYKDKTGCAYSRIGKVHKHAKAGFIKQLEYYPKQGF